VLSISILGGWWLRSISAAPHVEIGNSLPLHIGVYVRDRSQNLNAVTFVRKTESGGYEAVFELFGNPIDVLITSNLPEEHNNFKVFESTFLFSTMRSYVLLVNPSPASPTTAEDPYSAGNPFVSASFALPRDAILDERGTFAARLPAVGAFQHSGMQDLGPPYGVVQSPGGDWELHDTGIAQLSDQGLPASTDPSDYGLPDPQHEQLFWDPGDLTSKIDMEGGAAHFVAARIDTNGPSPGVVEGEDVVWNGGFRLSPFLVTTSWDTVESRSRQEFYSGVMLGLASAAFLALAQELPGKLRRVEWMYDERHRRGKHEARTQETAADEDEESPAGEAEHPPGSERCASDGEG
jgi:hypothetical protein